MDEGLEASQSTYCIRGGCKENLVGKAFFYTSNGIGFRASSLDAVIEPTSTADYTRSRDPSHGRDPNPIQKPNDGILHPFGYSNSSLIPILINFMDYLAKLLIDTHNIL